VLTHIWEIELEVLHNSMPFPAKLYSWNVYLIALQASRHTITVVAAEKQERFVFFTHYTPINDGTQYKHGATIKKTTENKVNKNNSKSTHTNLHNYPQDLQHTLPKKRQLSVTTGNTTGSTTVLPSSPVYTTSTCGSCKESSTPQLDW